MPMPSSARSNQVRRDVMCAVLIVRPLAGASTPAGKMLLQLTAAAPLAARRAFNAVNNSSKCAALMIVGLPDSEEKLRIVAKSMLL